VDSAVAIQEVVHCLRRHHLEVELRLTERVGDGVTFAREAVAQRIRRVIAAGGDGTINEVVQGLAGTDTELAVIPLGTGNIIARYAGLDEADLTGSCRVAAGGRVKTLDLGVLGGRYFVATAGAGLDAAVSLNLDPWWKQRVGKLAYLGEFFKTLVLEEPHIYRVRVGSAEVCGPMWGVLICNTNEYTWRIQPAPDVREDDGLLDAVFIHRQGFLNLMDLAARMFLSGETATEHPTATVLRVGEMEIGAEPPVPWQVEGDVMGRTPVSLRVVPEALKLVVADRS
jgi:YegS/Rv2252/BmrU family lipid kinase